MKLDQIEAAAELASDLRTIGRYKEFLAERKVLALDIGRNENDFIRVSSQARIGTGSLSGFKLTPAVQEKLHDKLMDWLSEQDFSIREKLKAMGVSA